jgi:hypothetical protein
VRWADVDSPGDLRLGPLRLRDAQADVAGHALEVGASPPTGR